MTMMISALNGMQRAETQLDGTATRMARLVAAPNSDRVDLSAEAVRILAARNEFEANVKIAQVGDEMQQSTLSLIG
jgi:flagellar hook protein FlgE